MNIVQQQQEQQAVIIIIGKCFIYFGFFVAVHFISQFTSWKLSTVYKSKLSFHEQVDWNKRVVGSVFPLLIAIVIWFSVILDDRQLWLFSLMYVAYDFSLILWDRKSMTKEMLFHHICMSSLLLIELYIVVHADTAKVLLLTELSTPFLNIRWFLLKCGMNAHISYMVNGVCLWLSFLLFRAIPLPFCLYDVWWWDDMSVFCHWSVFICVFALLILNYFWFGLITTKLFEAIGKLVNRAKYK